MPGLAPVMRRVLPKDSHTYLNLDGPEQGPLFEYAFQAALKRTQKELDKILTGLEPDAAVPDAIRRFVPVSW